MMHQPTLNQPFRRPSLNLGSLPLSGQFMAGILLVISLFAFELFNFDTTQYALEDLLGQVSFAGLRWASILAIAFCAIDFAGLVRFFMPVNRGEKQAEVWYLMGAWLLGATMNALMTWWAVSLTLINHDLGNEVLSRQQLLETVPVFVAVLVWLTRILFIGALTVAGDHLFQLKPKQPAARSEAAAARPAARPGRQQTASVPSRRRPAPVPLAAAPSRAAAASRQPRQESGQLSRFLTTSEYNGRQPENERPAARRNRHSPPVIGVRRAPAPMQASGRQR